MTPASIRSLAGLAPEARADLIFKAAQTDVAGRLWQTALGSVDREAGAAPAGMQATAGRPPGEDGGLLASLLSALSADAPRPSASSLAAMPAAPPAAGEGAGPNAHFAPALARAAERTGVPAPALAAIVNAEAAKGPGGAWLTQSRNPRSSAAGLGQFLSRTWIGEAERPGSWLHAEAGRRGWLDASGKVAPSARAALLQLRYDGEAAIEATADYARANLDRLTRAGVRFGDGVEEVARAAYLGHHLGLGDAMKFLQGGLSAERARTLLSAQVGSARAEERIAASGAPQAAHRSWLDGFMARHVKVPDFFR